MRAWRWAPGIQARLRRKFWAFPSRGQPNGRPKKSGARGGHRRGVRRRTSHGHHETRGPNVASDPLFTVAYTGVSAALIVVSADDPGMASSQNRGQPPLRRGRRRAHARAFRLAEAYDFMFSAIELSERWKTPVLLRLTPCARHSYTAVQPRRAQSAPTAPKFERDIKGRVMIPAYARPAHRRLRRKLSEIQQWNESSALNRVLPGSNLLGIITSGICFMHVREAAPEASVLK